MGEIDDTYAERAESLENEFFEEFKKGKNRKKIVEVYHQRLEGLVTDFEKKYQEHFSREKKRIN